MLRRLWLQSQVVYARGLVLGWVLFNILINDLDGTEFIHLNKFIDNTKPEGMADTTIWLCCYSEVYGQAGELDWKESRDVQQRKM